MENKQIWVDKYRPQRFDDIIGQSEYITRIRSFVETKSMPHLLFAGSPGTGKTTTAHVIANELYGIEGKKGNLLELNASDDRGIDIIRNQIKEFAKLKSLTTIPYKIIILDEADSLTKEAQQALRRTMEKYSTTCRFILACNEISKILEPIQSRCIIFKFKPLQKDDLLQLMSRIEKEEKISIEDDAKELLITFSQGDVRKITNTLQTAASINSTITSKIIEDITDAVNPKEIQEIVSLALQGEFEQAKDKLISVKIYKGYTGLEIIKQIYKEIISLDDIDPKKKIKLIDRIATVEFRLVEGSDEEIQLQALLALMAL
jgi:replication factor C small subunit